MRFVFAKSRLRTRYKSLFLVFSGKLHDAIMSGQVSLTVENVFMENNIFRECVFWTLTVRMMFLEIVWNLFCLAWCICSTTTTSKLHFISTGFACQRFWTWLRWFLWRTFISGLASFCRILERCICNICKCMWKWRSLFSFCFSWNLEYDTLEVKCMLHALNGSSMLHDRIKEKQRQHCTVADRARTSYLCLFCVLREKGESEVKWEFVGFWLACVCKFIHRHRRLGSDPNA